jgi:hypothetical protein
MVGVEPTTNDLTGRGSTTELHAIDFGVTAEIRTQFPWHHKPDITSNASVTPMHSLAANTAYHHGVAVIDPITGLFAAELFQRSKNRTYGPMRPRHALYQAELYADLVIDLTCTGYCEYHSSFTSPLLVALKGSVLLHAAITINHY